MSSMRKPIASMAGVSWGRDPQPPFTRDKPDVHIDPILDHAQACKLVGRQELAQEIRKSNQTKMILALKNSKYKLPDNIVTQFNEGVASSIFETNHHDLNTSIEQLLRTIELNSSTELQWRNIILSFNDEQQADIEENKRRFLGIIKTAIISEIRRSEAMHRIKSNRTRLETLQNDYDSCENYINELETANKKYARIILIMGKMWNTLYRLLIGRATYAEYNEQIQQLSAYDNELIEEIPDLNDDDTLALPLACLSSQISLTKGQTLLNRHNQLVAAFNTSNNHVWGLVLLFTLYMIPYYDFWIILGLMITAHVTLYMYNRLCFNGITGIAKEIDY